MILFPLRNHLIGVDIVWECLLETWKPFEKVLALSVIHVKTYSAEVKCFEDFVAFVDDNATVSSIRYSENHAS